jgi:hypothetical protein
MKSRQLNVDRTIYFMRMVDKRTANHAWILDQVGEALSEHLKQLLRARRPKQTKRKKVVPAR